MSWSDDNMAAGISEKLLGRRGASAVLALILLLVCSLAGSAVLGASSAGAGHRGHQRSAEQQRLSAVSAAKLIASDLEDGLENISAEFIPYESGAVSQPIMSFCGMLNPSGSVYSLMWDNVSKAAQLAVYGSGQAKAARSRGSGKWSLLEKPSDFEDVSFTVSVEGESGFGDASAVISARALGDGSGGYFDVTVECGGCRLGFSVKFLTETVFGEDGAKVVFSLADAETVILPAQDEEDRI